MFQTKLVEKIKTHFVFHKYFSFYCVVYEIIKALSRFHCNNGHTNSPHCYVIRKLPVLLKVHYLGNP